jgi:hypothetical protein
MKQPKKMPKNAVIYSKKELIYTVPDVNDGKLR